MARIVMALTAGFLFGTGLTISQMINPAKVLGFLDLAGDWDPSLAFVMLGAVPIAALGYRLALRLERPVWAPVFAAPPNAPVDLRLAGGAILFGIGWGLVGYCPGPALAALGLGNARTLLFVAAMLAGMSGFTAFQSREARRPRQA